MDRARSLGIEIEEISDPVWRSTSFGADAPHGFVFAEHGTHYINLGEYMVGEKRDWAWMMGELVIAPCPDIGNDCEICDEISEVA